MSTPVFLDDHCAQCDQPLPETNRGLFCAERCSQTAKHIRYWRRVERDGRIEDPDVQLALNTRIAFMLGPGYPDRARRLRPDVRRQVLERDAHRCRGCGAPGEEIDHIDGNSDDLTNLQLLCRVCHHDKTDQGMRPATAEHRATVLRLHLERVVPDPPTRLCDDDERWPQLWLRLRSDRRLRLDHSSAQVAALDTEPDQRTETIATRRKASLR